MVKEPLSLAQRMQAFLSRFERLALTHFLPTLRPRVLRWTVNLTAPGSESVKETFVPSGAFDFALIDGPEPAALNTVAEKPSTPRAGFVRSRVPGGVAGLLPFGCAGTSYWRSSATSFVEVKERRAPVMREAVTVSAASAEVPVLESVPTLLTPSSAVRLMVPALAWPTLIETNVVGELKLIVSGPRYAPG